MSDATWADLLLLTAGRLLFADRWALANDVDRAPDGAASPPSWVSDRGSGLGVFVNCGHGKRILVIGISCPCVPDRRTGHL
jgi:hypothetical protein